jgi:hypothetical protein
LGSFMGSFFSLTQWSCRSSTGVGRLIVPPDRLSA